MTRQRHDRDTVRTIAAAQDGLITAGQLRTVGVPSATVSHRTRAGGMWTRVLPGVHLVAGGSPDRLQREQAAILYAGEGALLTGHTALRHLGMRSSRRLAMKPAVLGVFEAARQRAPAPSFPSRLTGAPLALLAYSGL